MLAREALLWCPVTKVAQQSIFSLIFSFPL